MKVLIGWAIIAMILLVFLFTTASPVARAQEAQAPAPSPKLSEAESLRVQLRFKDYQLMQATYQNLYNQFLSNDDVKRTMSGLEALKAELMKTEEVYLMERSLDRTKFFLDFQTGEIRPVPAQPVAPPPSK